MIKFPRQVLVNTPSEIILEGNNPVALRINGNSDFFHMKKIYGKRLFNIEIDADVSNNTALLQSLKGYRVRIHLANSDLSNIGDVINTLKQLHPVFVVNPDNNLTRNINFLTSCNFPVHLNTHIPTAGQDLLENALDFYLHNHLLSVPIEPFHTLLRTESMGKGFNLWDIEGEKVSTNFFISENGKIALSSRWSKCDLNYGVLDDSWEDISGSKLYNNLSSFQKILFKNQNNCIYCPYLKPCGGFLRAIDPDWPCEDWKKVFAVLHDEVKKTKELLKKRDESKDRV
ncbi:MAG: hypothetical protein KAJ10_14990 [Thermodesulfovibrionia bacterium]|nr:hypothetical protein [Thermodesulfovibrionia bacterium]